MNIAQSAVSRKILGLEEELGAKLFDRSRRKVALTEAGRQLFPEAVSTLEQMNHMRMTARRFAAEGEGHIRMLTLPIIGQFHFYTPIHRFEMEHPDTDVELIDLEKPALFQRIHRQEYDLAIVYKNPYYFQAAFYYEQILEDEVVLAVPEGHPLAEKAAQTEIPLPVTPAEIAPCKVLAMETFTTISHLCESWSAAHGSHLNIVGRARPETILSCLLSAVRSSTIRRRRSEGGTASCFRGRA